MLRRIVRNLHNIEDRIDPLPEILEGHIPQDQIDLSPHKIREEKEKEDLGDIPGLQNPLVVVAAHSEDFREVQGDTLEEVGVEALHLLRLGIGQDTDQIRGEVDIGQIRVMINDILIGESVFPGMLIRRS